MEAVGLLPRVGDPVAVRVHPARCRPRASNRPPFFARSRPPPVERSAPGRAALRAVGPPSVGPQVGWPFGLSARLRRDLRSGGPSGCRPAFGGTSVDAVELAGRHRARRGFAAELGLLGLRFLGPVGPDDERILDGHERRRPRAAASTRSRVATSSTMPLSHRRRPSVARTSISCAVSTAARIAERTRSSVSFMTDAVATSVPGVGVCPSGCRPACGRTFS